MPKGKKTVYINANPPPFLFPLNILDNHLSTHPPPYSPPLLSLLPCDTSIWTFSGSTGASSGALSPWLPCRLKPHIPSARFSWLGLRLFFFMDSLQPPSRASFWIFRLFLDLILHLSTHKKQRAATCPPTRFSPQRLHSHLLGFVTFLPYDLLEPALVPVVILQKDRLFRSRLHLHLSPAPLVFIWIWFYSVNSIFSTGGWIGISFVRACFPKGNIYIRSWRRRRVYLVSLSTSFPTLCH